MSAIDNVNPRQFVERVKQTGGATMGLRSGQLVQPGRKAYMVGQEPDRQGQPVPTQKIPLGEFNEQSVTEQASRLRGLTGGRGNLGAWQDEGNVEIDLSGITQRKNKAIKKGRIRGEKEIWDNQHMQGINTGGRADK